MRNILDSQEAFMVTVLLCGFLAGMLFREFITWLVAI